MTHRWFRYALALVMCLAATGCGYDVAAVNDATGRAELSADKAEKDAAVAEAAAHEAQDQARRTKWRMLHTMPSAERMMPA